MTPKKKISGTPVVCNKIKLGSGESEANQCIRNFKLSFLPQDPRY